jgi:hypothetical protein
MAGLLDARRVSVESSSSDMMVLPAVEVTLHSRSLSSKVVSPRQISFGWQV